MTLYFRAIMPYTWVSSTRYLAVIMWRKLSLSRVFYFYFYFEFYFYFYFLLRAIPKGVTPLGIAHNRTFDFLTFDRCTDHDDVLIERRSKVVGLCYLITQYRVNINVIKVHFLGLNMIMALKKAEKALITLGALSTILRAIIMLNPRKWTLIPY